MKKIYIIILFSICFGNLFSQNWLNFNKTNPNYSFSLPLSPNVMDTMNIRLTWLKNADSITVFQVLEFSDTPLDSTNIEFNNALIETNGDTLLSLAKSISVTNNYSIISSQNITSFVSYKGLETCMKYTDTGSSSGKTILIYMRSFYNPHTLITFTITGQEDHLQSLLTDKNRFFNSISFSAAN